MAARANGVMLVETEIAVFPVSLDPPVRWVPPATMALTDATAPKDDVETLATLAR